jgi:hypothetical protein
MNPVVVEPCLVQCALGLQRTADDDDQKLFLAPRVTTNTRNRPVG